MKPKPEIYDALSIRDRLLKDLEKSRQLHRQYPWLLPRGRMKRGERYFAEQIEEANEAILMEALTMMRLGREVA